jgi:hypothetical protein
MLMTGFQLRWSLNTMVLMSVEQKNLNKLTALRICILVALNFTGETTFFFFGASCYERRK